MRTFINCGKSKLLYWAIGIDENDPSIIHMHSWLEGSDKKKKTWDRPGSVGKEGTKAYRDPQTYALIRVQQEIDKKLKQGYREAGEAVDLSSKPALNFRSPQKGFSLWKPQQKPTKGTKTYKHMMKVIDEEAALFTVKRDGNRHLITIDDREEVNIFTRRLDRCTEWYPWLVEEIQAFGLPPKTLLDVELVVEKDGVDDRRAFQSLSRSLKNRALDLQTANPWKKPTAIVIGTPIWHGDYIIETMPVIEWMEHLYERIGPLVKHADYVQIMEMLPSHSFDACKQIVEEEKREGLVIYDMNAVFGDHAITNNGHPHRPAVWKWVPVYEGDFIVVFDPGGTSSWTHKGDWGKGRRKNLPGRVALYQYGGDNAIHYVGLCGSGFDEATLQDVLDRTKRNGGGVAGVAKVSYRSRAYRAEGGPSNALTIPVFMHWRDDKTFEEAQDDRLGEE